MYSINCNGRLVSFDVPHIMGILNVTPDSFYDGGKFDNSLDKQFDHAVKMHEQGALIIDIGGASSRPGAQEITEEEELNRVLPIITRLANERPEILMSIDTYRAKVAAEAVAAGAQIVNDISAGNLDEDMIDTVIGLRVPYIAMHMQGRPENMQNQPEYDRDVLLTVVQSLAKITQRFNDNGCVDVIIDPGFGFGKTDEHNFTLLARLQELHCLNKPILVGVSRKSMICRTLLTSPANALNGTTAAHMAALMNGANLLRVHDVQAAVEVKKIYLAIQARA